MFQLPAPHLLYAGLVDSLCHRVEPSTGQVLYSPVGDIEQLLTVLALEPRHHDVHQLGGVVDLESPEDLVLDDTRKDASVRLLVWCPLTNKSCL